MPLSVEAMKALEGMHFRCMTSLLGISRMCSRKKLLATTGAECMHDRAESLSWAANAMRRDASFIVHHALADYRRALTTASSFYYAHERNRLYREYETYRRREYDVQTREHDVQTRETQGQEDILTPWQFTRESRRQRAAELRSQFEDLSLARKVRLRPTSTGIPYRRPILQWLLNCIPYAGRFCQRCSVYTISKVHVETCVGTTCPMGKRTDMALKRAIEAEDTAMCEKMDQKTS